MERININRAKQKLLRKLSQGGIDIESSRKFADKKAFDPLKIFYKKLDYNIINGEHQIPIRIYFPDEVSMNNLGSNMDVLLFFHGGGWITESIENYNRVCARLSKYMNQVVISVEYRLAPENPFPLGFNDCYTAAKSLYLHGLGYNFNQHNITIIGDSAGGNLAACVAMKARDTNDFKVEKQILIYPVTGRDYSDNSPFESVHTNGESYFLTAQKMQDYVDMYVEDKKDLDSPYFSPLNADDYANIADTLIITAGYDPLRDEGEEYGRRLSEAGNKVTIHRIDEALHGYFALGIMSYHLYEAFGYIKEFLNSDENTTLDTTVDTTSNIIN